jgi:TRAP transporter TAXI family solute receptor
MAFQKIRSWVGTVQDYSRRHRFELLSLLIVLALAALITAIVLLKPMPPRTLTMATGPEGSAYHEFGMRYREILAREGIRLRLLTTAGDVENLARLRDSKANVAVGLVKSGITSGKESPGLASLGTVFYEPMWFFYRDVDWGKGVDAWKGKRISIGPNGSGTQQEAVKLLARTGIDRDFALLLPLTHQEAGDKLVRDEIDAAIMLASWNDPVVQRLLKDKGIKLVSYPRVDAYVALFPYLNKLVLPQGVVDLAQNLPPANVNLMAPKGSLVVRNDLHPALQYLLLDAAEQIHSGPGIFQKAGQFPAAESIDLPLSEEARQFYKSGKPFFQRQLPFWMAALLDRLLVLLVPIIGVIYPLARFLPSVYDSSMRKRIYRLYGELRLLEKDLEDRPTGQGMADLNERLDRIQYKANRIRVPATYANMLYTLRGHIVQVREIIRRL